MINQKVSSVNQKLRTGFPIIFIADCLKKLQNFKCGILLLVILNQIKAMDLPITSLLYKP